VQRRYFIEVPPTGDPQFFSMPEKDWKGGLGLPILANRISNGCQYMERFKAMMLPNNPYCWVDEDGFAHQQPPNMLLSRLYGAGHVVGKGFLEVGSFDLMKSEDVAKWDKALAKLPKWVGDLMLKPDKVEAE
jgi:hypothetical protein